MNTPRTFVVEIEVLLRQKVEVQAVNEAVAEGIALDTFTLVGAEEISAYVHNTEEVTTYRGATL